MNTFKLAAVLIVVLLLPNVAVSADAAKEAYQKGMAFLGKGDFDAGIANLTEAIRLKPDYAEAYCSRGIAYEDKGEFDKAIADFTEAVRLKPDYFTAYSNRGAAYERKGDFVARRGCRLD